MNKLFIFIVVLVFLILWIAKMYIVNNNIEHLTAQSDEAIQNLASLYNKDQLTIGALNVTGNATTGPLTAKSLTDNSMGKAVKAYVDEKVAALTNNINSLQGTVNRLAGQINSVNANAVKKNVDFVLRARTNSYNRQGGYFVISDGLSPRLYTASYKPHSFGTAMYITQ